MVRGFKNESKLMVEETIKSEPRIPTVVGKDAAMSEIRAHQRRILTWLAVLTAIVAGFGLLGGVMLIARVAPSSSESPSEEAKESPVAAATAKPGPWGQLIAIPIKISPPLELLRASTPIDTQQVVWYWPGLDSARLHTLLMTLKLSNKVSNELMSLAHPDAQIHGLSMRPSREFILKLNPKDRSELYTALSEYPHNSDQGLAFRYYGRSVKEWLRPVQITPATKELLRPLIYQRGDYLFFADLRCVETAFTSPEERTNLLKGISCEPTYMLSLKISPHSNIEPLVRYWGKGDREKDVRPLIEAVANTENGDYIAVAHLLPRFARNRLWTYPVPAESGAAMRQDCHWSALNFFSNEPDNRYCNIAEVFRALTQDYDHITDNPQLGDIVEFLDESGSGRHSAVYIADDFVFTKNGVASSRPWMLMKLDELKGYYPTHKPFEIRYYRHKDL